jgi:hydroxymethylglutaryl-CoA reductase
MPLPANFRKLSPKKRLEALEQSLEADSEEPSLSLTKSEKQFSLLEESFFDLSSVLIENSLGFTKVPLGLVPGFKVNGESFDVPLATEEPSVVAAVTYAGRILCQGEGIQAIGAPPLTKGQVFFPIDQTEIYHPWDEVLEQAFPQMEEAMAPLLTSMTKRGGGFQSWEWTIHKEAMVLEVGFWVDTRDAMGANLVNSLAETISPILEKTLNREKIMAILSNSGAKRLAQASFSLPLSQLARIDKNARERAQSIVRASQIASAVSDRAVTHNKGIMNGISALALATGNDTRALEAAVHAYASQSGKYRALSRYSMTEDALHGEITLPLPLATFGGAVSYHPGYAAAMKYLGKPSSETLTAVGAAIGLAQNFAAILALTGPGIQKGHMGLHAGRLAYQAGARGEEIPLLVKKIQEKGVFRLEDSQLLLKELKNKE